MEAQCERESAEVKDNEQSQKDRGKIENFKNCSCFCKTRDFRDWIKSPHSRQLKPPEYTRTKF